LADLFARQVAPAHGEITPKAKIDELLELFEDAARQHDRSGALRAIGERAVTAVTVPEDVRRAVIAGRLPSDEWPQRDLRVTAVDVQTGELAVFDRHGGTRLVDAVAASCAVPCIWPTVAIGGRRYMDGGIGSSANLGVVADAATVVMLAPTAEPGLSPLGPSLADEAAAHPGRVLSVFADAASLRAFGRDPLDPDGRVPSANAGRAQGRRQAAETAAFLGVAD
jgi:NTE family protein